MLEEINLHNPEALRKIRDESANGMAKVAAVRQLEVMQNGDEATRLLLAAIALGLWANASVTLLRPGCL